MADDDNLQLRIEGTDASAPALSSAQAGFESYVNAVNHGASSIKESTGQLQGAVESFGAKFEEAFSAKALLGEMATNLLSIVGPLAVLEAGADAVKEAFREMAEFIKEGVKESDSLRDLGLSLNVVTGSAKGGADVMEFFRSRMDQTRNTAHELGNVLRDLAPIMDARRFTADQQEGVTLMLSQLATIRGQSLDAMEAGLRRVFAGSSGAGRNQLLFALGITKDKIDGKDIDEVIDFVVQRMVEKSKDFSQFGNSFDSEMKKIKHGMLEDFAEGFNGSRDIAKDGMDAIKAMFEDPELVGAIKTLGQLTAVTIGGIGNIARGAAEEIGGLTTLFSTYIAGLRSSWEALPAPIRNALTGIASVANDPMGITMGLRGLGSLYDEGVAAQAAYKADGRHQYPYAIGPEKNPYSRPPAGAGEGEDTTAADSKAMEDRVRLIGEKARLEEQELADAYKLIQAEDSGNKLALENDKISYDLLRSKLDLDAKIAEAQEKLQDELDRGATSEAANTREYIAGLQGRLNGIGATASALRDITTANYWKTISQQEDAELTKANDSMDQFVAHAREHLAELPEAVAESARRSFAANKEAMDAQIIAMQAIANVIGGGKVDPEVLRQIEAFWKQKNEDDLHSAERIGKMQLDNIIHAEHLFVQQFSSDFASIIESGGHNFTQILAGGFKQTVDESVAQISKYLIGTPGDAKQGQIPGHMYTPPTLDASGNVVPGQDITDRSRTIQGLQVAAQIGAAGYQAGFSGVPGSRTGAELGGALSGAATGFELAGTAAGPTGAVIGAIAGFVIAAIGGAIGAQQRQADYKYGIPEISGSGVATFVDTKNYTPEAAKQVARQIQGIYDSIHDSLAMVLIKAGALVPVMTNLGGQIQPNPSGHFEEHLSQFIQGTLPEALIGQFKDDLGKLAGTFGLSADRFGEIWMNLQNLDPQKVVQLLGSLFDSLASLDKVAAVTHATNPMTFALDPAFAMFSDVQYRAQLGPGAIIHEMDDQILKLAAGLKEMSPEGQITTLAQIAQLNQARYQAELQMIQQLYALIKQIDAQAESAIRGYGAQKILKDDGTPDQYGLSQYYKKLADQDLRDIQNAKNADALSAAWAKYQQDVGSAESAGYGQDPTKAGKTAWAQWGIDSITLGKQIAEGIAQLLGASLNPEQSAFNKAFDPIMELFKNGVMNLFPKDGPGGGGPGDPLGPDGPVHHAYDNLTASTTSVASALATLADVVNTVRDEIANGGGGGGRTTSSGFIARTAASR